MVFEVQGAADIIRRAQIIKSAFSPSMRPAVKKAGLLLEGRIKGKASGRPGPRVRTGNYRRSWNTQEIQVPGTDAAVSVGTNAPQGRRLEFGFRGRDALNRAYNQPPFPHVEPALAEAEEDIVKILDEALDDLI